MSSKRSLSDEFLMDVIELKLAIVALKCLAFASISDYALLSRLKIRFNKLIKGIYM